MPIEPKDRDAARARLRAATEEAALRTHPGYEPDEQPANPHGGDAAPYPTRQASLVDRLEQPGRVGSHVQKIVGGAMAACALLGAVATGTVQGFRWAVDTAVEDRFDRFRKQLDPIVLRPTDAEKAELDRNHEPVPLTIRQQFAVMKDALEKLQATVDAPNNPHSVLGAKLDALDASIQRVFPARPTRLPLPSVGPTAKAEGRQ